MILNFEKLFYWRPIFKDELEALEKMVHMAFIVLPKGITIHYHWKRDITCSVIFELDEEIRGSFGLE